LILKNNFPEITKISELLTPEVIQELKAFSKSIFKYRTNNRDYLCNYKEHSLI